MVEGKLSEKEIDRLAYSQGNWSEFLPVASEFYIKGNNEFLRTYGLFIGNQEAQYLYKFMKDEIFLGKEYKIE